ncbi:MAG: BatA domain-containing protein [Gemmatimonadetes bacterium]|nr:BatA domain-containing protein [Gemmatimonadota bacterium]
MTFLAPLFLAGLAALAVPIIVHLTNRPKSDAYPFPSLMFLQRVPFRTMRRQRIRHWWLLAMRAAVLVLVAAAFARPLLERLGGVGGSAAGREVVLLLDASYSMRFGDHWQRAQAAARRVVNGLGADDRATIVLVGDRAVSLGQATADKAALLAAVEQATPGFGTTRYAGGIQAARDILEPSSLPRREVVVISDFQRTGWHPDDDVRLPEGTAVDIVNLVEPDAANVAVTGLLAERAFRGEREQVTISARVANLGAAAVHGLPVALIADGRTVQRVTVDLDPRSSAVARFSPLPLGSSPARVTVHVETTGLAVDDDQHAVLAPGDLLQVLLAEGRSVRSGDFLMRALSVGATPRFAVSAPSGPLRPGVLERQAVVVLEDAAPGRAAPLTEFVRQGGGLLVLLGGRSGGAGWGPEWRSLLGGTPGGTVEPASPSGLGLAGLSYDHPMLEPFRAPRSGDFGSVHVYRYRRLDPDSGGTVLARYDDGAAALIERRLGAGRIQVWTSGMDNVWSDLPVQPVFLPLVHQMVRYLAGYTERRAALTVGQALDLDAAREILGGGSDLVVEAPSGSRAPLDASAAAVSLDEPGFYTLRALDSDLAPATVAVNLDPTEADLTPLDPDAFVAAVAPGGPAGTAGPGGPAEGLSPADRERRQGLWWYLVAGAVVLALAESFLSNRLPVVGRAKT